MDEDSIGLSRKRKQARYSLATEDQRTLRHDTALCTERTALCLHRPLIKFQQKSEAFGFLVVKHPKKVILTCLLFVTLPFLGFMRFHTHRMPDDSFDPSYSLSKKHLEKQKMFHDNNDIKAEIMIIPKDGSNVFAQECLEEALTLHRAVSNITGYKTICSRSTSIKSSPCVTVNVFEIIDFDSRYIQNFSAVLFRELNQTPKLLSNGRTLPFLKNTMFSHFKMTSGGQQGNHFSAQAMKMTYFIKKPGNDTFRILLHIWEHNFVSMMDTMKDKLNFVRVEYMTDSDERETVSKIFSPNVLALALCISVLLVVTFVLVWFSAAKRGAVLFCVGFFFDVYCTFSAVALAFAAGVSFSNAAIVILVFLVARGAVDVMIVVFELESQMNILSIKHRIAGCTSSVGLVATTSALVDIVVFAICLFTSFTGIKDVFLIALFNVTRKYIFLYPFLLASSFLIIKKYHSFLDHRLNSLEPKQNNTRFEDFSEHFRKYGHQLTKRWSKILVMTLSAGIIVACVCIQLTKSLRYEDNAALLQSTRSSNYKLNDVKYFRVIDVNILLLGSINYRNPLVHENINSVTRKLDAKSYSTGEVSSWIKELLSWSKANRTNCQGEQFPSCLNNFLSNRQNALYKKDIVFDSENSMALIKISRFHLFMKLSETVNADIENLLLLRNDVKRMSTVLNVSLVPASSRFLVLDMISIFKTESFKMLLVVGIALMLCPQPLLPSIRMAILLVITFILHVEQLVVLVVLWQVPINPISFYCLLIGLLWALHLSTRMLQVLLAADLNSKKAAVASLKTAGPGIAFDVLISIACCISLSLTFPFLFTIMLCVFPIFFVLALFHSLAVLPTIILLWSKSAVKVKNDTRIEEQYVMSAIRSRQEVTTVTETKTQNKQQPTVSIIGMGCRFPQAKNKDKFMEMLLNGTCAVSEFPSNRPEEYELFQDHYHPTRFVKRRLCTVGGAFLDNIRGFDAEFFRISPQEAPAMDPQQRILLQTVYEAIEDAGLRLEDLQKCKTGVVVGVMNLDYGNRIMMPDNLVNMDQFYSTGTTATIVANRISFCFNLTGPSLAVDTACSSSLTALKVAQGCLKNGDCDVAIVCSSNIILDHVVQMTSSIGGFLAPDGRCKCYDATADGYGRGEGFAAVILKPTLVAMADNDDIYCEILACGMNNDGQNANPITAPSPKTQAELSRIVLEEAGVPASSIEYVEAHGTGTVIGDDIETSSIASTYCDRSAVKRRILRVGSVKSNLNHTESTSGLAGLIKVALMIKNELFLPTVNVHNLNPKLKISEKGMVVQQSCEKWVKNDGSQRIAAINSFGYGGSNVHAILKEIRPQLKHHNSKLNSERNTFILILSTRSEDALKRIAKQFKSWLKEQQDDLEFKLNLCYSLTERRSHHENRLGLVFHSLNEASDALDTFINNQSDNKAISGTASSAKQSVLFVFGGQGANWEGMGKDLMENEPLFKKSICEVDKLMRDLGEDWSLIDELKSPKKIKIMGNIVGQPAAFAIQYATYKLLESWGIHPAAVVGHSLGELAAACCSGALSLKQALQIVSLRSKWHEKCSKEGSMAALGMSEHEARNLITDLKLENTLCIAAVNDQNNVTISGNKDSIECIGNHVNTLHPGVFWRVLQTARAFHSMYIDAVKSPFCAAIEGIKVKPKIMRIPMYSTVLGTEVAGKQLKEQYWWQNMRQPVLFNQAVTNAIKDGHTTLIEISPQPVLKHYLLSIAKNTKTNSSNKPATYLPTFPPRKVPDHHKEFLKNTVCQLYTTGYTIYWPTLYGQEPRALVRFPSYPWKETEYWYRDKPPPKVVQSLNARQDQVRKPHPFLQEIKKTEQYSGVMSWETDIDLYRFPTFKDHVLAQGGPVLPGSACVEMAIAMAAERFQRSWGIEARDVKFTNILTLPESQVRLLRLRLEMRSNNIEGDFSVSNVQDDGTEMVLTTGSIFVDSSSSLPACLHSMQESSSDEIVMNKALQEVITSMKEVPLSSFRLLAEKLGYDYGPCYSLVRRIWRKDDDAVCMLEMDGPFQEEIPSYIIHPTLIDACFQTTMACEDTVEEDAEVTPFLPIEVKGFSVIDPNIPRRTYCHVSKRIFANTKTYSMRLVDALGKIYVTIDQLKSTDIANLVQKLKLAEVTYETNWVETQHLSELADMTDSAVLVMKDNAGVSSKFVNVLSQVCQDKNPKILAIKLSQDVSPCANLVDNLKATLLDAESHSKLTVINFWPVDTSSLPFTVENFERCQELSFMSSLEVLKVLAYVQSTGVECKLVVVSRCTQYVSDEKDEMIPWSSTVWGLCRTARLEFQNIRTINVDLGMADDREIQHLVMEIAGMEEVLNEEIVLRFDKRYVNRIKRASLGEKSIIDNKPVNTQLSKPVYLALDPNNAQLCLRRSTLSSSRSLSGGIVQIKVKNFWIQEEIPVGLKKSSSSFIGYSGSVMTPTEDNGNKFKQGDLVFGVTLTNRLSNILHVKENYVIKKPVEMSLQQAASLSSCLPLAYYALEQALPASKSNNGIVIIHEANKDLGLASLLVAKSMGLSVVCTTSDPDNEDSKQRIREQGAMMVTDAHLSDLTTQLSQKAEASIFFYEPLSHSTRKSCDLLKPGGKIVLLGDIANNLTLMPSNKSISCQRIDHNDIMISPEGYESLWSKCWQQLTSTGTLKNILKLPQREISIIDILTAEQRGSPVSTIKRELSFSSFSFQAKDDTVSVPVLPVGMDQYKLKHDRTYMVAGGVRGFGFEVARWMAYNGAGTIVLVARSKPSQSKLDEISLLERETGAKIKVLQADISDQNQMDAMYANELSILPSMAGIVHTAMVLRDQLIPTIERPTVYQVMAPKVKGAYFLHQMSLNMDLDFFVMFSSIASVFGNPGQSTYSAANSFLDSLACYRRKVLGLPALTINWGPIKGAGVLERQADVAAIISKAGYRLLDANQGIELMEQILIKEPLASQISLFDTDWSRMFEASVDLSNSKRFESIKQETQLLQKDKDLTSLGPKILMEIDQAKKQNMVKDCVTELIGTWQGTAASDVDMNTSLYSQGLDSFFALTFKMQLESTLQVSFEVFYFMQPEITPFKIVQDILAKLNSKQQNDEVSTVNQQESFDETIQDSENTHGQVDSTDREYPKDTSCPTATYQVMPLFAPEGARVMFFCVHPASRYALNVAPISAAFQTQSLISFYAIGYTDPTMSGDNRSVRQLASSYVKMIKQLQKHGPYFVGGQSFGGLIAFEMASVLQEQGEDVAFVAMLDTFPCEISSRPAAARIETVFGEKTQEQMTDYLFQITFEKVLESLAFHTLKLTPQVYSKKRKETTQDGIIDFLQEKAQELDIPLYNIRTLRNSLQQDSRIATAKHQEWQPAEVYFQGPLTFLKSADQRFTPVKILQPQSPDDAWSLVVGGNIDVYLCPGDHLAFSDPDEALVTGSILATAIGVTYRRRFGLVEHVPRTYLEKKAIQQFMMGVGMFLYSKKESKPPKYGKLYLDESESKLIFRAASTKHVKRSKGECDSQTCGGKVIDLTALSNVLPGRHVAKTLKIIKARDVGEHQTGNINHVVAIVTSNHRVYSFELVNHRDLKAMYQMMEAIMGVSMVHQHVEKA